MHSVASVAISFCRAILLYKGCFCSMFFCFYFYVIWYVYLFWLDAKFFCVWFIIWQSYTYFQMKTCNSNFSWRKFKSWYCMYSTYCDDTKHLGLFGLSQLFVVLPPIHLDIMCRACVYLLHHAGHYWDGNLRPFVPRMTIESLTIAGWSVVKSTGGLLITTTSTQGRYMLFSHQV